MDILYCNNDVPGKVPCTSNIGLNNRLVHKKPMAEKTDTDTGVPDYYRPPQNKKAVSTIDARADGPAGVAKTNTGHSPGSSQKYNITKPNGLHFNFDGTPFHDSSIPVQRMPSDGWGHPVCQPSDTPMDSSDVYQNGDMVSPPSLRSGTKAEMDPHFFGGLRPTSSGEFENLMTENAQMYGPVSGRSSQLSLVKGRNEPGIKAAGPLSVKVKQKVTHSMTKKAFMSHEYNMAHGHRGKAIIINNVVFNERDDHQAREGSFNDVVKLREIFERMNFEPIRRKNSEGQLVYTDLTVGQIKELLLDASNPALNDYTDYDCFLCMVTSYGMDGAVLCAGELTDEFMEIKDFIENFKPDSCPSLLMKPKIFLFQLDPAFSIEIADAAVEHDSAHLKPNVQKVPKDADILVQCCYVSGFYGWLDDNERGLSWFVRALTQGLQKFVIEPLRRNQKPLDFLTVMNRVNYMFVRIMRQEGLTPDRQIGGPQVMSTFTKKMIFQPKPTDMF